MKRTRGITKHHHHPSSKSSSSSLFANFIRYGYFAVSFLYIQRTCLFIYLMTSCFDSFICWLAYEWTVGSRKSDYHERIIAIFHMDNIDIPWIMWPRLAYSCDSHTRTHIQHDHNASLHIENDRKYSEFSPRWCGPSKKQWLIESHVYCSNTIWMQRKSLSFAN